MTGRARDRPPACLWASRLSDLMFFCCADPDHRRRLFNAHAVHRVSAEELFAALVYQLLRRRPSGYQTAVTASSGVADDGAATVLGTSAAIGIVRGSFRGRRALECFFVSPMVVPTS